MLEEARFAVLVSRAASEKGAGANELMSAEDALILATLGGARALGLDAQIGSLEDGKQADLTIVALNDTRHLPVYDAATALIFASSARDVQLTMVAGREVYRDNRMLTVDEECFQVRLKEIARKISGK